MRLFPDWPTFLEKADTGRPQLVWAEISADLFTPVSAYLRLAPENSPSFLLESVERGANRGRYSIIGISPDLLWRCEGRKAVLVAMDESGTEYPLEQSSDVIASLRAFLARSRLDVPDNLPSMACGAFGFVGFDMVRFAENLGPPRADALGLPMATLIRPRLVAVFDSVTDTALLVRPVWMEQSREPEALYADATQHLNDAASRLQKAAVPDPPNQSAITPADMRSNTSAQQYRDMVERAKAHIRDGDVYQVVLSQRFSRPFTAAPFSLYRALRRSNPSPFMYYLNFVRYQIVGSSPEILVRLRNGAVTVRPLAGTRPRGLTPAEDARLARDLLADPKERAEHLMLLDLGRNDVGRVAEPDSVRVSESHSIERYSHVMHIVSNVEGKLKDGLDAVDTLLAGFPAGTVSGAPKIRAIEIIDSLEPEPRGPYAGAVGYFAADGDMDTCIVLRTAVLSGGQMHVQAGAGIVADSDATDELAECHNKARAVFRAAELAEENG